MPLYELFALAKPALAQPQLAEIIKAASQAVFAQGGVLTDIKSFGQRPLAYDIRKPGEKYSEVRGGQREAITRAGGCSRAVAAGFAAGEPTMCGGCACMHWPLLTAAVVCLALQAHMWQITFSSPTSALPDLDHLLRVDERVLRWMVLQRRPYPPLPNTYRVARAAQEVAASLDAPQQQAPAPQQ